MRSLLDQEGGRAGPATWRPRADIYQTRAGWLIKIELAGVREEDLEVRLKDNRVTVGGIRRDCVLRDGLFHHSMEIAYSRFERTFALPSKLTRANLSTEYQDGMLMIALDFPEEGS
jgi:HSP20 family protein